MFSFYSCPLPYSHCTLSACIQFVKILIRRANGHAVDTFVRGLSSRLVLKLIWQNPNPRAMVRAGSTNMERALGSYWLHIGSAAKKSVLVCVLDEANALSMS